MKSRFALGALRTSQAAKSALHRIAYDLICRHALCDHGQISMIERRANERSLVHGGRVVSRYRSDPTNPNAPWVIVVTEAGGIHTTVFMEHELTTQR
ncbi:hypothetical protein [Caldimonas sp. KR1-144]|uniref:hypothetical protein n=1 Tax=Caldimonas sp. KR1-144 TaxID=3400911 RepID=UPI003C0C477B